MYITNEMRETYNLSSEYNIVVGHAQFIQTEWNQWSIVRIHDDIYYLVK